jgi:signal transduction histidine kinase
MNGAPATARDSAGAPWVGAFSELWRSSVTRLLLGYGALFAAWSIVLIGAISWETARYLENVVDRILQQRVHFLNSVERGRLPDLLAATTALDLRGVMSYGLFDADNRYLLGDIDRLPADLPIDGQVHALPHGIQRLSGQHGARTRGVALRRESDDLVLVLVREYGAVDRVGTIIRGSLFWALSLMLIPGLLGGFLLARGPLRRVRSIEAAMEPIMRGDLRARLPVSTRRDELDMLAAIVNRMLDQIERLLGEVKGVSDNIAHDLRTPLTRLRAQLHRLQREQLDSADGALLIERCVGETNALLDRFRALLRISELEDLQRRAGFGRVDLSEILRRVHELYAPLAEDNSLGFSLQTASVPPVDADPDLLFEAVTNLVSNAIKFTPPGGLIVLASAADQRGARIEVLDSGPGIAPQEREAVLQRFYRAQGPQQRPGFGLGLSIVAAIVRLHGFRLEIAANQPVGTRMTIHCFTART